VRIISGNFRGKSIIAPPHLPVRPTTDFAKTGLFNILASRYRFAGIRVADLFAGTGSLSYEFFSRGCTEIIAVDRNAGCIRFIRDTFKSLQSPPTILQVQSDALEWINKTTETFDVIVADPPFAETPAEELVSRVKSRSLLRPGGILIIEHSATRDLSSLPGFTERRKYGLVCFSFFMFSG
jgi:16S rRNA (guanine(966)-N(2))-methyltransferase RsmD